MHDSKEDFLRHMTQLGFELEASREWVSKKFRRLLGEARFAEFKQAGAGLGSAEGSNKVYELVRNMTEANLLRSVDPDVTADTSYHLYRLCKPHLVPGATVTELGCWTGGLASFIAALHPRCEISGVDRVAHIINLNAEGHKLPNLHFYCWDYRNPKPQEVPPGDVLLCGLGIDNTPGGDYEVPAPESIRQNSGYKRQKADAAPYFRQWRHASKEKGILYAVLRVVTFGRFIAFLDAAQEAGWTALLERCDTVVIETAGETLPCLVFEARQSARVPQQNLLALFIRLSMKKANGALKLEGAYALALYESFREKQILETSTFREKSVLSHDEIGTNGSFGYVFRHDATPRYMLAVTTIAEAHAQRDRLRSLNAPKNYLTSLGLVGTFIMAPLPTVGHPTTIFDSPPGGSKPQEK